LFQYFFKVFRHKEVVGLGGWRYGMGIGIWWYMR